MRRLLAIVSLLVLAVLVWSWLDRPESLEKSHAPAVVLESGSSVPNGPRLELANTSAETSRSAAPADEATTEAPELVAASQPGFVLTGRLIPAVGRTALTEKRPVGLTDASARRNFTMAGLDGEFRFEGLAPGRHWIDVESFADGRAAYAVVDVERDARCELQLVLVDMVSVRVFDEFRRPVKGRELFVAVTAEVPPEWIQGARAWGTESAGLGTFRTTETMPPDVIGQVVFHGDLPLHVALLRSQRVLDWKRVEPGQEYVDFTLRSDEPWMRTGSVRMRVVAADTHEPLIGANVMLDGGTLPRASIVDGAHELGDLMPGTWRFRVSAKGHGSARVEAHVLPGATTDLGDIELQGPRWISGRIVDETAVPRVHNLMFDPCDAQGRFLPKSSSTSMALLESQLTFRIDGLGPTFVRVELSSWYETVAGCARVFDLRRGPVEDVRLVLVLGVPLVVDPDGRHGFDARFDVIGEDGMLVTTRFVTTPLPVSVTLAPGQYSLEFRTTRLDPSPRIQSFEIVRDPVVVRMR